MAQTINVQLTQADKDKAQKQVQNIPTPQVDIVNKQQILPSTPSGTVQNTPQGTEYKIGNTTLSSFNQDGTPKTADQIAKEAAQARGYNDLSLTTTAQQERNVSEIQRKNAMAEQARQVQSEQSQAQRSGMRSALTAATAEDRQGVQTTAAQEQLASGMAGIGRQAMSESLSSAQYQQQADLLYKQAKEALIKGDTERATLLQEQALQRDKLAFERQQAQQTTKATSQTAAINNFTKLLGVMDSNSIQNLTPDAFAQLAGDSGLSTSAMYALQAGAAKVAKAREANDAVALEKAQADLDKIKLETAASTLDPATELQARNLATSLFGKKAGSDPTNINLIRRELAGGKTVNQIEDELRKSGYGTEFTGAYKSAYNNISVGFSKDKRDNARANLEDTISEFGANSPQAKQDILNLAGEKFTAKQQEAMQGRITGIENMRYINNKLKQFVDAGGQTGMLTNIERRVKEGVGLASNNPKLNEIANEIGQSIITYRQSVSGAAFTESEAKAYESLFPSSGNTPELNQSKINSLLNTWSRTINTEYQHAMGRENFNQLFPDGTMPYLFNGMDIKDNTQSSAWYEGGATQQQPQMIGDGSDTMRTDRHNNPTAFTTDIAKQAGLEEGVDYIKGDAFPNNPNQFTAKLIGDPIQKTIDVIDKIGFYTASGQPRWTHTAIDKAQWDNMSPQEKSQVVADMYKKEGGSGALLEQPTEKKNIAQQQTDSQPTTTDGKQGFLGRLAGDFKTRFGDISSALDRADDQSAASTALQIVGSVAGFISDIPTETLISGFRALPDFVEDPIRKGFSKTGEFILNTETGQAGLEAAKRGMETYDAFAKEHPTAAANLEAIVNIAELIPASKAVSSTKKASKAIIAGKDAKDVIDKQIDTTIRRITDAPKGTNIKQIAKGLDEIDISKAKSYDDITKTAQNQIDRLKTKQTELLRANQSIIPKEDLKFTTDIEVNVGGKTIKESVTKDFISDALDKMETAYDKISPTDAERIRVIKKQLNTEGLNLEDINNIAGEFGSTFKRKAFDKSGNPLSSVTAGEFEGTRKGVKDSLRQLLGDAGEASKQIDESMSSLIKVQELTTKASEKVSDFLKNKQKDNVFKRLGEIGVNLVDAFTLRLFSGMAGRLGFGNRLADFQTLSPVKMEKILNSSIKELDKLSKLKNENQLLSALKSLGISSAILTGQKEITTDTTQN